MRTTTRTTTAVAVLLDPAMPALVPVRTTHTPDLYDNGMAYWIGPDAVIACDLSLVERIGDVLEHGGWHGRTGTLPVEKGIAVMPFDPDYQDVSTRCLAKNSHAFGLWRMAQDTVLLPTD